MSRWGVYAEFHEGPVLVARAWFRWWAESIAIEMNDNHRRTDGLQFHVERMAR